MKVDSQLNCGNSPKMAIVEKLSIHFAAYELDEVEAYLDEQVVWTLEGDDSISGRDNFLTALAEMKDNKVLELKLLSIVCHGKDAALRGEMQMADGSIYAFADFYTFSSAAFKKVISIHSFISLIRKLNNG